MAAGAAPGPAERFVKVASRDGTTIAASRSGAGPSLVLVHGASADRGRWRPALPLLEPRFTCYAMDRRGRGASGDGPSYALEREAEDVAALCDALPGPVHLLGHSYGGLCALGGARLSRNVGRLVLYEPAVLPGEGDEPYPPGSIDRLQALLDAGDREGVLHGLMRDMAGVPEETIALMRTLPAWQGRLAAVHTVPRELREDDAWRFDPAAWRAVRMPVLLLLGGASPPMYRLATEALQRGLADARTVILPGQGHAAIDTGTDLFVREVTAFLTS